MKELPEGRFQLLGPRNIQLRLSNVTMDDSGYYLCSAKSPGRLSQQTKAELIVCKLNERVTNTAECEITITLIYSGMYKGHCMPGVEGVMTFLSSSNSESTDTFIKPNKNKLSLSLHYLHLMLHRAQARPWCHGPTTDYFKISSSYDVSPWGRILLAQQQFTTSQRFNIFLPSLKFWKKSFDLAEWQMCPHPVLPQPSTHCQSRSLCGKVFVCLCMFWSENMSHAEYLSTEAAFVVFKCWRLKFERVNHYMRNLDLK